MTIATMCAAGRHARTRGIVTISGGRVMAVGSGKIRQGVALGSNTSACFDFRRGSQIDYPGLHACESRLRTISVSKKRSALGHFLPIPHVLTKSAYHLIATIKADIAPHGM